MPESVKTNEAKIEAAPSNPAPVGLELAGNQPIRYFDPLEGITMGAPTTSEPPLRGLESETEALITSSPPPPTLSGWMPPSVARDAAIQAPKDQSELPVLIGVGEALYQIKEPEWIVEGLLAKGQFVVLAGQPKRGKKTLLSQYLSICLARGEPFLGLQTKPCRVVVLNLEDGFQQVLRRYRDFGIQAGDPINISILADEERLWEAIEIVKQLKPDVVIIDPLMELEIAMGVRNENNANEMAPVLKMLRSALSRKLGCLTILLHHFGVKSDRARGSSALQGSPDGWFDIHFMTKLECYRLSWWLRNAPEGHADLSINYTPASEDQPGAIKIDLVKAPVFGDDGMSNRKNDDDDDEGSAGVTSAAYIKVCKVLQEATEPMTKEMLREATSLRNNVIQELLSQLRADNLIVKANRRWTWNASPASGSIVLSDFTSPSAQAFIDREASEDDADV